MRFVVVDHDIVGGKATRIVLRPLDVHSETLAELVRLYKRDFSELCVSLEGDVLVFTGVPLSTEMLPKACLRFAHSIEGRMRLVGWVFTAPHDKRLQPQRSNTLRPKDLVLSITPIGDKTPEELFAQLKEELKGEGLIRVELTRIGVRLNFTYLPERQIPVVLCRRSPQLLAALELGGFL